MADDKDEKYKGSGKFTSMVGRGLTEGATLGAVGTGIGAIVESTLVKGRGPLNSRGVGFLAGGALGLLHGGYRGVKNAMAGKEQHEKDVVEKNSLKGEVTQQKGFVEKLTAQRDTSKDGPGGLSA